jgi:hypothetical protein
MSVLNSVSQMKEGGPMQRLLSALFICVVLLSSAGAAHAAEMSGEVVAVDAVKASFTLKSGTVTADFACETNSLIKQVRVGSKVVVQYKEKSGKKTAVKITPMKKKVSTGC